jgi:hypothetical protein
MFACRRDRRPSVGDEGGLTRSSATPEKVVAAARLL